MLRIGIAGCGHAARVHAGRLVALEGVRIVGCADTDEAAAAALAARLPAPKGDGSGPAVPSFADHRELLAWATPDVLAVFTPHRSHYRLAMDALQAGCHVFVEKPLSTSAQEADDIANLAKARGLKVGVGHQYRLAPALLEARRRLADGAIGPLRLVVAALASPWLERHGGPEDSWRLDPKAGGVGILADEGDHLIDALLWTTGQPAVEVAAFNTGVENGPDLVTAAAIRLADGTPATLAVCGVSPGPLFRLTYFGEQGLLHATDRGLALEMAGGPARDLELPRAGSSIDADFVASLASEDVSPCCPIEQALDTVRLLEAIARSAASGQAVRVA